jgi:ribonuclease VapC
MALSIKGPEPEMVVDTSVLIALLAGEADAGRLVAALAADPLRLVSAASIAEASLVLLGRYGPPGEARLDRLLDGLDAQVVPVDESHVALAREGAARYGRGRHAAALTFGDCFGYALEIATGEPVLFTGDDGFREPTSSPSAGRRAATLPSCPRSTFPKHP